MPGSGFRFVPARAGRLAALTLAGLLLVAARPAAGPLQAGVRIDQTDLQTVEFPPLQPRSRGGVIIGTVVDSETGRGLPEARVTIQGPDTNFAIATDPLGRYYFVALPEGAYQISAETSGYAGGAFGRLRAEGAAQPLVLAANEWRIDANITMWRLAALEGIVTDEAGEGIIGVRVHALRRDLDDTGPVFADVETTLTDDRGYFRIGGLVPGEYIVMTPSVQVTIPIDVMTNIAETGRGGGGAVALLGLFDTVATEETSPGRLAAENVIELSPELATLRGRIAEPPPGADGTTFVYPSQYYPSTDIPSLAMPVELDPGMEFYGVAFLLRPVEARNVRGVVTGPAGPVSNQLLRLVPDTGQDFGASFEVARTISNLEGAFTFLNVPSGSYVLEARSVGSFNELSPRPFVSGAEERAEITGERLPGPPAEQWWARTPLSVFGDDVENLTVQLQPTMSVVGQIGWETGASQPRTAEVDRMRVSLKPAGGGRAGVPSVRPRATGAFALHGLWPQRYFLDVALPPGWFIQAVRGQGRDLTSDPIDASMGGESIVVAVQLTSVGTQIRGTVRDSSGRPASDMVVVAVPSDREAFPPLRTREVRVSSTGEYFITGLPPGRYDVVALTSAEATDWRAAGALAAARGRARAVTLSAGEHRLQDLTVGR